MSRGEGAGDAARVTLFAGTVFTGAVLLFWIQPLFTKMALPLLGGSPSVWNTAMVFFQAMLLAGYSYAHGLARYLRRRGQLIVHLAVLGGAALVLPVGIAEGRLPDSSAPPTLWLLALLLASLGAPFFAVAATAPLLQRWFFETGRPDATDPYFLYAASNAGSVAVLLAFPFVIEPLFSTGVQAVAWTVGFGTACRVAWPAAACFSGGARSAVRRRRSRSSATVGDGGSERVGSRTAPCLRRSCLASPRTSAPTSPQYRYCGWRRWRCIS